MNIVRFNNLIQVLALAKINRFVIDVDGENNFVRGDNSPTNSNVKPTAVVFSSKDFIVDKALGVEDASNISTRIGLLDVEQATGDIKANESYIESIQLQEGRKQTSITFENPKALKAPKEMYEDLENPISVFNVNKEVLNEMVKSRSSINANKISFECDGNKICFSLSNGKDVYVSEICDSKNDNEWYYDYASTDLVNILKKILTKKDSTTDLLISENGLLVVNIDGVDIMFLPQV